MSSVPSQHDLTQEHSHPRLRRIRPAMVALALSLGALSFSGVAGNARFEAYHTLDVIRLMTAGAAFGVALVLLIQLVRQPDSRSTEGA